MKSPVFGLGRNRKHRPSKSPLHSGAGNVNMRGKKYKTMSCGCCWCIDKREEILVKTHKQDMLQ